MKDEARDRTLWRTRCGRGFEHVRWAMEGMNIQMDYRKVGYYHADYSHLFRNSVYWRFVVNFNVLPASITCEIFLATSANINCSNTTFPLGVSYLHLVVLVANRR